MTDRAWYVLKLHLYLDAETVERLQTGALLQAIHDHITGGTGLGGVYTAAEPLRKDEPPHD